MRREAMIEITDKIALDEAEIVVTSERPDLAGRM